MGIPARKLLAANLNRLMAASETLRTVKQLSTASGVSTGTIDRLRRAEVSAGVDHLDALAKAFKLSPADLISTSVATQVPFRDLNTFEAQLVTFFRQITPDEQHEVLTVLNDMIPKAEGASPADPYAGGKNRSKQRGKSRLGELLDESVPGKRSASK